MVDSKVLCLIFVLCFAVVESQPPSTEMPYICTNQHNVICMEAKWVNKYGKDQRFCKKAIIKPSCEEPDEDGAIAC